MDRVIQYSYSVGFADGLPQNIRILLIKNHEPVGFNQPKMSQKQKTGEIPRCDLLETAGKTCCLTSRDQKQAENPLELIQIGIPLGFLMAK